MLYTCRKSEGLVKPEKLVPLEMQRFMQERRRQEGPKEGKFATPLESLMSLLEP